MNFKRYHESKNLFDRDNADTYQAYFPTTDYWMATDSDSISVKIPCEANTQYTLSMPISESGNIFRIYESNDINVVPASTNPPMLTRIIRAETTKTYTFTTSATAECIVFQGAYSQRNVWLNGLMFNEGEYKPYEPYSSEVWHDSHYIHNTSTDTITTLPTVLYPNAATATVGLKGNTVQNGTPTPDSPVMPQGTGERTGNLFDMSTVEDGKGIAMDGSITNYVRRCSTVTPIDVSTYSNVTLSFTATLSRTRVIYALFNDSTLIIRQTAIFSGTTIDVSNGNKLYICFYDTADLETIQKSDLSNVMLNSGSTALPYEPFGVKIPILSANTTTPVYLGEVETTRKIRKLVLTGEETWYSSGTYKGAVYAYHSQFPGIKPLTPIFCTHLVDTYGSQYVQGTCKNDLNSVGMWVFDTATTPTAFKSYLAAQYAAGTPVCVWYVLATPQTAVVNEPLMKIGEYADTLSNISIPVTTGGDTLSVGTTVQPSEVTVNYKGWHPVADVHERTNGAWT